MGWSEDAKKRALVVLELHTRELYEAAEREAHARQADHVSPAYVDAVVPTVLGSRRMDGLFVEVAVTSGTLLLGFSGGALATLLGEPTASGPLIYATVASAVSGLILTSVGFTAKHVRR